MTRDQILSFYIDEQKKLNELHYNVIKNKLKDRVEQEEDEDSSDTDSVSES